METSDITFRFVCFSQTLKSGEELTTLFCQNAQSLLLRRMLPMRWGAIYSSRKIEQHFLGWLVFLNKTDKVALIWGPVRPFSVIIRWDLPATSFLKYYKLQILHHRKWWCNGFKRVLLPVYSGQTGTSRYQKSIFTPISWYKSQKCQHFLLHYETLSPGRKAENHTGAASFQAAVIVKSSGVSLFLESLHPYSCFVAGLYI